MLASLPGPAHPRRALDKRRYLPECLALPVPTITENSMKKRIILLAVCSLLAVPAFAYQVTGPVLEVTDTKIVVEKGKEKWEIARTPGTTVKGDIKKGSRVTVEYTMSAVKIEGKDEKKSEKKK
jgi:hypothetical protein